VNVPVRRVPSVAVLGTGDELVEPAETPSFAQIRNSNSYQLLAQCAEEGWPARYLGIARDERDETRKLVASGLEAELFISTGGVSVGERDYVGATLRELGVEIFFDKVSVKPGKPTTFGTQNEKLVFGLPGNPVAALVCFHLFVKTAVRCRIGARDPLPRKFPLPLFTVLKSSGDRPTFRPCKLATREGVLGVAPLEWHGSGHLAALAGADGLFLQAANTGVQEDEHVPFYPF
jgi:molybdopterin molybdotransferase